MITNLDFAPTLLDYAGVDISAAMQNARRAASCAAQRQTIGVTVCITATGITAAIMSVRITAFDAMTPSYSTFIRRKRIGA